ncbi:MAG: Transketolase [Anaerolineales bacterium]|nr:Transketolase [Anaerolineales bacterium]
MTKTIGTGLNTDLAQLCVNTIRGLAMDAVQKAKSGHPGMPMGMADAAYVLWTKFLEHNPNNPDWPNRDRFVLSAGHGSMLLYSLLHLTGYDMPLDELQNFRQWGSQTPGHPEYELAHGVETTTGPLGQGFANGVGMALAERILADRFNRPDFPIVDHYTYAICSDGDLMEGVSHEAASLAGHLGLGKIIYLYDDNEISIEGSTDLTFTEDVQKRFEAYNWHTVDVNGHDRGAVAEAIREAQAETERPSLIIAHTHIAYGSPNKQDTAGAHGAPLGEEEVRLTKEALGWPADEKFLIPDEVLAVFRRAVDAGADREAEWKDLFDQYAEAYAELAEAFQQAKAGQLPESWDDNMPTFIPDDGPIATRAASGTVLNAIAESLPLLIGGSADLHPSNKTYLAGYEPLKPGDFSGRNIHFGVREHAMASILNGMALHGGLLPYGGTFLVFSDYARPSIRLAAMMKAPVTFVFTHDSIGVGEDGPTHQPVEQVAALRAIPNLRVIRPADANETAEAWRFALTHRDGPVAFALTRQKLPVLDRTELAPAGGLVRGAYVLSDVSDPDVILIASGSEVALALEAQELLDSEGIAARVVSMPSWELFEEQSQAYKDDVLPPAVRARVAVEAGVSQGWWRYAGDAGRVVTVDKFGASAPIGVVMPQYGFTPENVAAEVRACIQSAG